MKRNSSRIVDEDSAAAAAAAKRRQPAEAEDLRAEKRTATERLTHLLETGECADIHFLVGKPEEGQELISTHKLLLYAASPVFKAQFCHGNSSLLVQQGSTRENPIPVPDVRPDAFRALLAFFYSDDFSTVNRQNVMDVYGAAKKYMVNSLVNKCRKSLIDGTNLSVDNVCSVLKHAQRYEDEALINCCWQFVDNNAKAVLETEEFLMLQQADLCELFSRDTLDAEELFLFQSLHRWAVNKCVTTGLEPTPKNKRKAVGKTIYQIQVPRINKHKFSAEIVPSGLLTEKDIIAVLHRYIGVTSAAIDEETNSPLYPLNFRLYKPNGAKVVSLWVSECRKLMESQKRTFLEEAKNSKGLISSVAYEFLEKLRRNYTPISKYRSPEAFFKKLNDFLIQQCSVVSQAESKRTMAYLALHNMKSELDSKQQPILAKYKKQSEAAKEMCQQRQGSPVAGPSTSAAMNFSGPSTSR